MPVRVRRRSEPVDDVRIKRQELAHGVYNFKDVWKHYRDLGWTTRSGGELGYDHFYIKPGKSTRRDIEGEDFFYGEAALVAYGVQQKIFGDVPPPAPPVWPTDVTPKREHVGTTVAPNSSSNGAHSSNSSSSTHRTRTHRKRPAPVSVATHSTQKRRQQQLDASRGRRLADAIEIFSGSSDDHDRGGASTVSDDFESDPEFRPPADFDFDLDDDDDDSSGSSSVSLSDSDSDSDFDSDPNEDDIVVVSAGVLAANLRGNFRAKKASPRPLLRTSKGDKHKHKHKARHSSSSSSCKTEQNSTHSSKHSSSKRKHDRGRKTEHSSSKHKSKTKHSSTGVKTEHNTPATAETPRQVPPSTAHAVAAAKGKRKHAAPQRVAVETDAAARTNVLRSHRATAPVATASSSAVAIATDSNGAGAATPSGSKSPQHSFLSPTTLASAPSPAPPICNERMHVDRADSSHCTEYEPEPEQLPSPSAETLRAAPTTPTLLPPTDAQPTTLLALDDVTFPSQPGESFRVLITSTEQSTPSTTTTIRLEHLKTHEQRECTFRDIRQLDGAAPHDIPAKAIFEALVRCLRTLQTTPPTAAVESETDKPTPTDDQLGRVDLVCSDSGSDSDDNPLHIVLLFPCYEFWQQRHRFVLTRVASAQPQPQLLAMTRELETVRSELAAVRTQRDAAQTRAQASETECVQLRAIVRVLQSSEQQRQHVTTLQREQLEHAQRELQRVQAVAETHAALTQQLATATTASSAASALAERTDVLASTRSQRDARSFSARCGWLVTSTLSAANNASADVCVAWAAVLECATRFFQPLDDSGRAVQVLHAGTYQLNVGVTHESAMALVVWIARRHQTAAIPVRVHVGPTLVQLYNNKQRVSRLDRVLELCAGDEVSVHLRSIEAAPATPSTTCWCSHFAPQPNALVLTFLTPEFVYKEQCVT